MLPPDRLVLADWNFPQQPNMPALGCAGMLKAPLFDRCGNVLGRSAPLGTTMVIPRALCELERLINGGDEVRSSHFRFAGDSELFDGT